LAANPEDLRRRYDEETDIRHAAVRLWIDAIIDPARTRDVLILALNVATRNREATPLEVGVFQV
jgi:3-methylcrotonyl-CoA carboxylase beta subunit